MNELEIKTIDSIEDSFLKSEWERLETEAAVFPQNTYHWCSTWWRILSGSRKLHIVMALNEKGKAVAIAPLCVERQFGIPVLRSFPIHFGDFYTFITTPITEPAHYGIETILKHMASNSKWRWVKLDQISEKSILRRSLTNHGYRKKRVTGCVAVDFAGLGWDEYLAGLTYGYRKKLRRRLKKIEKAFKCEMTAINTWDEYEKKFEEMLKIHQERWVDDHVPVKGAAEVDCWKESIKAQFESGKIVYYQLLCDGAPVAYRLGFMHGGVYYDWHASFVPIYQEYTPGIMILAFMIKHFMDNGVTGINFMAGDYNWKLDWSPEKKVEAIYTLTSPSNNAAAFFLNRYHHDIRDGLKAFYHRTMGYGVLRTVSRSAIRFRQKFSGLR